MKGLAVQLDRPLFRCKVARPTHSFGHVVQFADREADNDKYVEFRPSKNPDFDLLRQTAEIGLQAGSVGRSTTTQTTWFRPVNKAVQYSAITSDGQDFGEMLKALREPALADFLASAVGAVEDVL